MHRFVFAAVAASILAGGPAPVLAQSVDVPQVIVRPPAPQTDNSGANELQIAWEVKSRFRLFRYERDFARHVAADRGDGILAAERRLAAETDGRGWARTMVNSLCADATGKLLDTCDRDGEKESYLSPVDHRIGAMVVSAPASATCTWTFDDGEGPAGRPRRPAARRCARACATASRPSSPSTSRRTDGASRRARTEILVRDRLIAGLGNSIAAGEGNPDRPIALSDDGFCFRRFLGSREANISVPAVPATRATRAATQVALGGADRDWSAPCRALDQRGLPPLALRLPAPHRAGARDRGPHSAVTFVPLACTGARIDEGLFKSRRAREVACEGKAGCSNTVPPQLASLRDVLAAARRNNPDRNLDLVLLTIGANDVQFSGLVADAIITDATERALFQRAGMIASAEDSAAALASQLPGDFARLRAALKPLVGGDLARVVYVAYANPAMLADGVPCPGGRDGFDVHPAFGVDAARVRAATSFVNGRFLPRIKALALCEGGVLCNGPGERMTFVDAHQAAFATHGFCARADTDPEFDTECFSTTGESFQKSPVDGAQHPLACDRSVKEFRPYASRARWIRTANDSYFAAMTYPEGASATLQPTDIHDATWGVMSAVYGGAMHPTAEGHAVMAEAALAAVKQVLGMGRTAEQ